MPELPEVEVVRAGLERHVVGARVVAVDVLHDRPVRRDPRGPEGFALALAGRTITGASRRGKYLWLPLDDGDALLCHLGMSGQMLVQPAEAEPEKHLRVRLRLDGAAEGRHLHFVDQRMFGGLLVSTGGAVLPPEIAHIGRDPLDPLFNGDVTNNRFPVKRQDKPLRMHGGREQSGHKRSRIFQVLRHLRRLHYSNRAIVRSMISS